MLYYLLFCPSLPCYRLSRDVIKLDIHNNPYRWQDLKTNLFSSSLPLRLVCLLYMTAIFKMADRIEGLRTKHTNTAHVHLCLICQTMGRKPFDWHRGTWLQSLHRVCFIAVPCDVSRCMNPLLQSLHRVFYRCAMWCIALHEPLLQSLHRVCFIAVPCDVSRCMNPLLQSLHRVCFITVSCDVSRCMNPRCIVAWQRVTQLILMYGTHNLILIAMPCTCKIF